MPGILNALPETDPVYIILRKSADKHEMSALGNVASGGYEGEYWHAAFAVYLLSIGN